MSSEDMNGAEPTWVAAEQPPVPEPSPPNGDRVSNPTAAVKEEDGKATPTSEDLNRFHRKGSDRCRKQLVLLLVD